MTTNVIPLARPCAPSPEAIRLHGLAHNALSTALYLLGQIDITPAQLQQATARAVRAATLLKRASNVSEVTA